MALFINFSKGFVQGWYYSKVQKMVKPDFYPFLTKYCFFSVPK